MNPQAAKPYRQSPLAIRKPVGPPAAFTLIELLLVIALFNDGHSEPRKDKQINPPIDPVEGSARGLVNVEFWDPLLRGAKR